MGQPIMTPYMYLFIREDLSHAQQIIQTSHAVDEIGKRYKSDDINHMVLCSATDEDHLHDIVEWLELQSIDHHMFYEPDIESFTAIATKPLRGQERFPMKKFKLKR